MGSDTHGERLIGGRYRIKTKIAEGGMGTVYEAEHNLTHQTIALKVLHPNFASNDAARQRFLREASAPAKINHPGICPVYDAGFDDRDGSAFVAMELLRGETLRERFRRELTQIQRLDLIEQMLEPLAAAHEKGIVHRDMKPENVFVAKQPDGTEKVTLLDFGIVREPEESNVTQAGMGMGTPDYMSPEQATSAKGVVASSDVWSVGVMIYEALGGSTPFSGNTPSAVVVEVITKPHVPVRSLRGDVPPPISDLIDRCLSKEPDARPRDAGELLHLLRASRGRVQSNLPRTMATPMPPNVGGPFGHGPATDVPTPAGYGTPAPAHTPPPTFGTPNPGPVAAPLYGMPPHYGVPIPTPPPTTPGPFGSQPSFGLPTPTPGFGTPSPVTPPNASWGGAAQSGSGHGVQPQEGKSKLPLFLALGFGALLLAGAGGLLLLFAIGSTTGSSARAQLRVITNISGGELYVNGITRGLVVHGQTLPVDNGTHEVEIRLQGAAVAHQTLNVTSGGVFDVVLQRAMQTFDGNLAFGDGTIQTGEFMDSYTFTWAQGANIQIDLTSSQFDPYLILRQPVSAQIDNDDAAEGQTAARITTIAPEPGEYTVQVTSFRPGETGSYQLRVYGP